MNTNRFIAVSLCEGQIYTKLKKKPTQHDEETGQLKVHLLWLKKQPVIEQTLKKYCRSKCLYMNLVEDVQIKMIYEICQQLYSSINYNNSTICRRKY